jgi:hypothetical protein
VSPIAIEIAPTREAYRAGMARLYELGLQQVLGNDAERVDGDTGEIVERRYVVSFSEVDIPLTIRQRAFLHGPVLGQIAEQVRMPDGSRYVAAVWKDYFRDLFLPPKFVMVATPKWNPKLGCLVQPKRATPRKVRQSTEDLSVKGYSELIDKILAHAASELGVVFDLDPVEREAVRYRRPARKVKAQQREAVEA